MQYEQVYQKTVRPTALARQVNEGQTKERDLICAKIEYSNRDFLVMFAYM